MDFSYLVSFLVYVIVVTLQLNDFYYSASRRKEKGLIREFVATAFNPVFSIHFFLWVLSMSYFGVYFLIIPGITVMETINKNLETN